MVFHNIKTPLPGRLCALCTVLPERGFYYIISICCVKNIIVPGLPATGAGAMPDSGLLSYPVRLRRPAGRRFQPQRGQ